jgi:hypothetical protein
MVIDPHYSINRLVIGVWTDAERKARKGDSSARDWLYGEGVLWLDIVLNIHPDHTRRYLRRVLKRRRPKPATSPQKPHRKPQDEKIPMVA